MIDPAESRDFSPYAPPSVIQDELPEIARDPGFKIAPALTAAYALGATLISIAFTTLSSMIGWGGFAMFWWLMPILSVAVLVVLCISIFSNRSHSRQRSLLWKIFMTIAVPPAAMLVFIPTCAGTGMLMIPFAGGVMGGSWGGIIFFIPVFLAMWATCHTVAARLASRFANPSTVAVGGPYHSIATHAPAARTPSPASPPSSPPASLPGSPKDFRPHE
ncbi:MAG: hypothetical protein ACO1RT_19610 [Planctomycetaceae bacterium]